MKQIQIGKFIAEERKRLGLTQAKLAGKLFVSEKTISKWECGNGFPDSTLILPLCAALEVSANELLTGKLLPENEYKTNAEENIVKLTNQELYKNKMLLTLEWLIGYLSVLVLMTFVMIASYVDMADVWRIVLIIFGFVNCLLGVAFALKIERDAGYYECGCCHHKYIPSYKQVVWSMHVGRTRYFKCPKCGKKSWNKKTISK